MSLGLHISKTMCKLHKICLYKLHVTLGPSLTTMQYVISERERVAICYRPSICNVRAPTRAVQIFGNISTALGTLAIH